VARGQAAGVLFTAGGIATPADAAMMMQLGAEGVFVGSGIFKSGQPRAAGSRRSSRRRRFYDDPDVIAKVSRGLGEAMVGINVDEIPQPHRLAERGWCALAYMSDLTLLGSAQVSHPEERPHLMVASLDHAMWFMRPFRADEWLLYDQSSPSAGGGRSLTQGKIFSRRGDMVAAVMQEGLTRYPRGYTPSVAESR
jgi:hypothetical protein